MFLIMLVACHLKNYLGYHLPTRERVGIKLWDVDTSQTYLYFLLVTCFFIDISICFRFTFVSFTISLGTNLLTQCPVPVFICYCLCITEKDENQYAQKILDSFR